MEHVERLALGHLSKHRAAPRPWDAPLRLLIDALPPRKRWSTRERERERPQPRPCPFACRYDSTQLDALGLPTTAPGRHARRSAAALARVRGKSRTTVSMAAAQAIDFKDLPDAEYRKIIGACAARRPARPRARRGRGVHGRGVQRVSRAAQRNPSCTPATWSRRRCPTRRRRSSPWPSTSTSRTVRPATPRRRGRVFWGVLCVPVR